MSMDKNSAQLRHKTEKTFFDPGKETQRDEFPFMEMEGSLDLSVIVPSFNEEKRLPGMLEETIEYLETRKGGYKYEVIVVDDGSKDRTTEVAQQFTQKHGSDKVRVLTLHENKGKGGAVKMGVFSSRGKLILMADADAATKFSDLEKLETRLKEISPKARDGASIAVGSRAHMEKDSIAQRSLFRTFLMKAFHLLIWVLCIRTVRDTQCGFKLLTRKAAMATFRNLHVNRWAFDVELLFIAESLGIPIVEVAVNWTEIDGSKMIPVFSWIQMGKDIVLLYLCYFIGKWKIKDFSKQD